MLEMLSIIICLRLWGSHFHGKRIKVFCDNSAVVNVINSGRAKCELLQSCLREIAFLNAVNECEIKAVWLDTKNNRLADHLSRFDLDETHRTQFFELTGSYNLVEYKVEDHLFEFINIW